MPRMRTGKTGGFNVVTHQMAIGGKLVHLALKKLLLKIPARPPGQDAADIQILGEDLNVGCVLSWGPCWYFQKQFFEGKVHKLSTDRHLMRYDVETSGFPSSHAGHLCL